MRYRNCKKKPHLFDYICGWKKERANIVDKITERVDTNPSMITIRGCGCVSFG